MDAREFDFTSDNSLPQTCQHCKWAEREQVDRGGLVLVCRNEKKLSFYASAFPWVPNLQARGASVSADHTCKHWEAD